MFRTGEIHRLPAAHGRNLHMADPRFVLWAGFGLSLMILQPAYAAPEAGKVVVIVENELGQPLADILLARTKGGYGRTPTDAGGKVEFDAIPVGEWGFEANCSSTTYAGRSIEITKLSVAADQTATWDITVPKGYCDEPEYAEREYILSGRFISEFEGNHFIPDNSEALNLTRNTFQDRPAQIWFDDLPEGHRYGKQRHVKVRATLKGPGSFGHMGMSQYELIVHEVLD